MNDLEKLELLRATLAVAAADGELMRSEMGVVEGLAAKVGIGTASFEAMVAAAKRGEAAGRVRISSPDSARTALHLLVAQARIDGEITDEERAVLLTIGDRLGIKEDEFREIYVKGIQEADEIRRRRGLK
jgi:tellurite resistance protein